MPTRARLAWGFACLWGKAVVVAALTVPAYEGSSGATGADGELVTTSSTATLVEVNGPGVMVVAAAPLVAALLVGVLLLAQPRHRFAGYAAWAVVVLLGGLAVVGLLSVGIFLVPVVIALAIAVSTTLDARARAATVPT